MSGSALWREMTMSTSSHKQRTVNVERIVRKLRPAPSASFLVSRERVSARRKLIAQATPGSSLSSAPIKCGGFRARAEPIWVDDPVRDGLLADTAPLLGAPCRAPVLTG